MKEVLVIRPFTATTRRGDLFVSKEAILPIHAEFEGFWTCKLPDDQDHIVVLFNWAVEIAGPGQYIIHDPRTNEQRPVSFEHQSISETVEELRSYP